jgi:hypothetical protein
VTEAVELRKEWPPRKISGIPPRLSLEKARECVDSILSNVAERRSAGRGNRQSVPISGKNISWQGKNLRFRGSDLTERVAVSTSILIHAGSGQHDACLDIASKPEVESRLGKSKRGHPRSHAFKPCELDDKAETVRGFYKRFWSAKEGALPRDQIVQFYFWGWWNQKYSDANPGQLLMQLKGTSKQRMATIRARQEAAIRAMSL